VELDESDYDSLYKFVENHEGLVAQARAQILQAMKSPKSS